MGSRYVGLELRSISDRLKIQVARIFEARNASKFELAVAYCRSIWDWFTTISTSFNSRDSWIPKIANVRDFSEVSRRRKWNDMRFVQPRKRSARWHQFWFFVTIVLWEIKVRYHELAACLKVNITSPTTENQLKFFTEIVVFDARSVPAIRSPTRFAPSANCVRNIPLIPKIWQICFDNRFVQQTLRNSSDKWRAAGILV